MLFQKLPVSNTCNTEVDIHGRLTIWIYSKQKLIDRNKELPENYHQLIAQVDKWDTKALSYSFEVLTNVYSFPELPARTLIMNFKLQYNKNDSGVTNSPAPMWIYKPRIHLRSMS